MKRILVCLDASQRAPHVLATALDLAQRIGAKLRLFRAVGLPPELPTQYLLSADTLADTLVENAKKELRELSRDVPPDLLDGICTRIGSPWDAICTAAREHDADLLVIGSHGYGAIDRLLGTTAAKVVNHADRSVLIVRPKGAAAENSHAAPNPR